MFCNSVIERLHARVQVVATSVTSQSATVALDSCAHTLLPSPFAFVQLARTTLILTAPSR